jgi:hypothetical protein
MTTASVAASRTLISAVTDALAEAAAYNRGEMVPPAVVIWPDKEQQWQKLMPLLRHQMTHLLTLGAFDPATSTGPAVWIKCAVAHRLEEPAFAPDAVPIIYLPGVSRAELRAVEDCAPELQPLAELQYRGVWFTQSSAKDWTVLAFLCSKDAGLGIDVARDAATLEAMQHTLLRLARTPVEQLAGRTLTHEVLNSLVHADPARAILGWLDENNGTHERDHDQWASFRAICKKSYQFDPDTDGRIGAAEKLGTRHGNWSYVWARFAEAPQSYIRIPDLLRKAQPTFKGDLFDDPSPWPRENDAREARLREGLVSLENAPQPKAIQIIGELETDHGIRRDWVWAKLGLAPLAAALEHLARIGTLAGRMLPGATREELSTSYRSSGWEVDAAAIDAIAAVSTGADEGAVRIALRALYLPWLERNAERLQHVMIGDPIPTRAAVPAQPDPGTCILFVDGMRYDVGRRLIAAMKSRGWDVMEAARWTAMPSVTATAKPAISPVADLISGGVTDADFCARVAATGAALTADRFRQLIDQKEIQYLPRTEHGTTTGRAWTEIGDLDRRGHEEGARLARHVAESIADIVSRVEELLEAGWKRVRLVTDHGWLLVPGGLPKMTLPAYLASSRWGRCASLKQSSVVGVPVVPWFWNPDVRVALAPGVGVFIDGREYTHGGASLQECLVPELTVTRGAAATNARITSVEWTHLRCKVQIEGEFAGCRLKIVARTTDSFVVAAGPKKVPENGRLSVAVENDDLEGHAATVVVVDAADHEVAREPTTIGG